MTQKARTSSLHTHNLTRSTHKLAACKQPKPAVGVSPGAAGRPYHVFSVAVLPPSPHNEGQGAEGHLVSCHQNSLGIFFYDFFAFPPSCPSDSSSPCAAAPGALLTRTRRPQPRELPGTDVMPLAQAPTQASREMTKMGIYWSKQAFAALLYFFFLKDSLVYKAGKAHPIASLLGEHGWGEPQDPGDTETKVFFFFFVRKASTWLAKDKYFESLTL